MKKVNVLYIDHSPTISGGQMSLLTLLERLDRSKFFPIVACDSSKDDFYNELLRLDIDLEQVAMNRDNIESREGDIYKRPLKLILNIPYILNSTIKLINIVREKKVNIIYSSTVKSAVFGCIVSKLTGVPHIYHLRCSRLHSYHGWIDDFIYFLSTRIIASSEFNAQSIKRWKKKTDVIYAPFDFERFNPKLADGRKIRKEFNIGDDTKLVGIVGRINPVKRHKDFLEAAVKVDESFSNLKFLVVGGTYPGVKKGEGYEKEVRELVKELDLQDKVIFTGFRQDIQDIISALDLLVLPSLREAFGRVLIEALALNTPVVASDTGGIPEIIEDGETGLLVPPKRPDHLADAIVRMLKDEKFAKELASKGARSVKERFSADVITRQEEQLYLEAIHCKKGK